MTMTATEKNIGWTVSGCLNDFRNDGENEITREMIRNISQIFCKRKDADYKKVARFVESKVPFLMKIK